MWADICVPDRKRDGLLFRKMKVCGEKNSLPDKLERIYAGVLEAAGHKTAVQRVFLIDWSI